MPSTPWMNIPRRIMSSQRRSVAQNTLSSLWGGGKMVVQMFWWCRRPKYRPVSIFTTIRTTSLVWKIRHRPRPLNLSLEPTGVGGQWTLASLTFQIRLFSAIMWPPQYHWLPHVWRIFQIRCGPPCTMICSTLIFSNTKVPIIWVIVAIIQCPEMQ